MVLTIFNILSILCELINPIVLNLGFSEHQILIAISYTIYPTSSYFIAHELMSKYMMSLKDVLIGIYLGHILFTLVMEYPRHTFPFYASIYGVRLAFKITTYTVIISLFSYSMILMIIIYLL